MRPGAGRPVRRWRMLLLLAGGLLIALALSAGPALVVRRPLSAPDAIISLASHEWERLPTAARLAAAAPDARVVLTRPPRPGVFNCHDCDHRVDRLRYYGVAESRVDTLQLTVDGTYGEALAARGFAQERAIRRLIVTTSPYHTRRALAVFRKVFQGLPVDIGVEPASDGQSGSALLWWVRPVDLAYVPYEWAGLAYYAWMHGVWQIGV
jgi:uncharacterized SAM-binding protein YcdF (DUF218 family)